MWTACYVFCTHRSAAELALVCRCRHLVKSLDVMACAGIERGDEILRNSTSRFSIIFRFILYSNFVSLLNYSIPISRWLPLTHGFFLAENSPPPKTLLAQFCTITVFIRFALAKIFPIQNFRYTATMVFGCFDFSSLEVAPENLECSYDFLYLFLARLIPGRQQIYSFPVFACPKTTLDYTNQISNFNYFKWI